MKVIVFGDTPLSTKIARDLDSSTQIDLLGVVCSGDYISKNNDPWPEESLSDFASLHNIPKFKLNDLEKLFSKNELDLGFSCRFSKIFKNNTIELFKDGIINFHGGLLPEMGGVNSVCHSILLGDKKAGGTMHFIDKGIDTGEIIQRAEIEIGENESSFSLYRKTQLLLWDLYKQNIYNIINRKIDSVSQDSLIEKGYPKRYFGIKDIKGKKEILVNSKDYINIKKTALAFDFPGHEPAYIRNEKNIKIYLTSSRYYDNKLESSYTPLKKILKSKNMFDFEIFVKHDDRFGKFYGGNKARKIDAISRFIKNENYNYVVTNGSLNSNHVRATALMCSENNLKCSIIYYGQKINNQFNSLNYLLTKMSCSNIKIVDKDKISSEMDKEINNLKSKGFRPYYLWGGGHNVIGVQAYVDAIFELKQQCDSMNWSPDYIFLASGTGSTQIGLEIGARILNWDVKIIGISISRDKEVGISAINSLATKYIKNNNLNFDNIKFDFRDDWHLGGYQKQTKELLNMINKIALETGLILDPIYSGKAFNGMINTLKTDEIKKGAKILFWHTGGILNLNSKVIANG